MVNPANNLFTICKLLLLYFSILFTVKFSIIHVRTSPFSSWGRVRYLKATYTGPPASVNREISNTPADTNVAFVAKVSESVMSVQVADLIADRLEQSPLNLLEISTLS